MRPALPLGWSLLCPIHRKEENILPIDFDIVCLSHLRWDFVYQRPQHIMTRLARDHRVFFVEEPHYDAESGAWMEISKREGSVTVAVPHLPAGTMVEDGEGVQSDLLANLLDREEVRQFVLWFYTPMALPLAENLSSLAVVYDCMDELSAFRSAPASLRERERVLLRQADLVFTGGHSLYEAKQGRHPSVHCFPSSVDVRHFASALRRRPEPKDQAAIPHPRLGFYGVIDERMDLDLVRGIAAARPDWHLVFLGPVAKVEQADLPHAPNIHYLGHKAYADLPRYVAGWDVALLPFVRNESTRFISPTKTPEYLAAGRPVVSTSIRDVVRPYGQFGLVHIADTVDSSITAVEAALSEDPVERRMAAESYLRSMSWDRTVSDMETLISDVVADELSADEEIAEAARV
jgi:glycosyltransferase involved in cell wall biosynthesis